MDGVIANFGRWLISPIGREEKKRGANKATKR